MEKINWKKRESLLLKTLARYRKSNGQYDVIVPGSGGKDSAYVSYLLKHKYGMNPLTVTWSPHLYTEIGKKNFYNWINIGGFDNILFTPNGALQRYLTRMAFVNLLHPFQPFIIGQRMIGPKIALKFGIKLIMYGETGAQYGNSISENKIPTMNAKYFTANNISDIFLGGLKISSILKNTKFKLSDFNPYIPILRKKDRNDFEVHHMSFYKNGIHRKIFILPRNIVILSRIQKEQKALILSILVLMIKSIIFTITQLILNLALGEPVMILVKK
jgi:hypothetical protein